MNELHLKFAPRNLALQMKPARASAYAHAYTSLCTRERTKELQAGAHADRLAGLIVAGARNTATSRVRDESLQDGANNLGPSQRLTFIDI